MRRRCEIQDWKVVGRPGRRLIGSGATGVPIEAGCARRKYSTLLSTRGVKSLGNKDEKGSDRDDGADKTEVASRGRELCVLVVVVVGVSSAVSVVPTVAAVGAGGVGRVAAVFGVRR